MEKELTLDTAELATSAEQTAQTDTAEETVEEIKHETEQGTEQPPTTEVVEEFAKESVSDVDEAQRCAYQEATAVYTPEQALECLRKKLLQYQEIDEGYLHTVQNGDAITGEMKYLSMIRCSADVRYDWATVKNKERYDHSEDKALARDFHEHAGVLSEFDLRETALKKLSEEKRETELLFGKKLSVSRAKKDFHTAIKAAMPNPKAKITRKNESYERIYVPVWKASFSFEGETYCGYVNLLSGACVAEYKISERLQNTVERTMGKVKEGKRSLWNSFVFLCLLCVMSLAKGVYHGAEKLNSSALWMSLVMAVCALVPIGGLVRVKGYKRERMQETAVHTGKMPAAKLVKWLVYASWLVCAVAIVLFFLKTVMA